MNSCGTILLCVLSFCLVAGTRNNVLAQQGANTARGEQLLQYVKGIEGKSPERRREFIKTHLKAFGVTYVTMAFDTVLDHGAARDTVYGENILVTMGAGKKKIVVGAHYDAVPGSPGANDNGAGVAVILEMIRNLMHKKLKHTVDFCFFDQEESGLLGSAIYVRRYDTSYRHMAMINLDVEGTGNEIYVGPVGGGDDNIIMKYIHAARKATKFSYEENATYPGSDYESFANAKLENISLSVVPKGDVEKLVKWTKSGFRPIENVEDMPEVLKVMHSPRDSSAFVTTKALTLSYEFTATTLRLLDAEEP